MKIFLLRFCAIVNDFYQFPGSREYFQADLCHQVCWKPCLESETFVFKRFKSPQTIFISFEFRWDIFKLNCRQLCWKPCLASKTFVSKDSAQTSTFLAGYQVRKIFLCWTVVIFVKNRVPQAKLMFQKIHHKRQRF